MRWDMKRWIFFLLIFLAIPGWAWADAATKLGRGLNNTLFGWFEVVNEVGNESDRHGPWIGFPAGIVRGAAYGIARTVVGAYELVTFVLPNGKRGYDPLILPELVWVRR